MGNVNNGTSQFYNSLNVSDGGTLTVAGDLNNAGNPCNSCAAQNLTITNGSVATVNGVTSNSGGVLVDGTSLLNAKGGFVQTAGSTVADGILNAQKNGVSIQGGTLSGTGIVNGNVIMAGTMLPGDPTGIFTINGNYTQTSTGTLAEEIGWLNGSNASLLDVNGNVDLDGTLALAELSGFDPTVGESFILMEFSSDYGSFNTVTGLDLGNDMYLDLEYDPHDVRVVVESQSLATPEPSSLLLLLAGCIPVLIFSGKRLRPKTAKIPSIAI